MGVLINTPCFKYDGDHRGFQCTGNFRPTEIFAKSQLSTKNKFPLVLQLPTPIKSERLALILHGYQQDKINYLIEGFEFGFSLPF